MSLNIIAQLQPYPGSLSLMYYDANGPGAIGNLFFVNTGNITDTISVALTLVNQQPDDTSYILYNTPVTPNHTVVIQDICLGNQERLYVYSQTGNTSFTYTGQDF